LQGFDLVLELIILQVGEPGAVVAGDIILELADAIILAHGGHDLRDRLPHALFIRLCRLSYALWERT